NHEILSNSTSWEASKNNTTKILDDREFVQVEGEHSGESCNKDRHWNRLKKKSKPCSLENISINSLFSETTPASKMSPKELAEY
ncbi:hypothetical protein ACH5RR_041779, partial [Cinchona calisaya]